jgi:hypothetical protein
MSPRGDEISRDRAGNRTWYTVTIVQYTRLVTVPQSLILGLSLNLDTGQAQGDLFEARQPHSLQFKVKT